MQDLKNPWNWQAVDVATVLAFDAPVGRKVRLSFNSEGPASVFVAGDEAMTEKKLLAWSPGGRFDASYSAEGETFVQVVPTGDGMVFVSGHAPSQMIEATDDLVLTTLEPQGRRNSDYDRMLQFMRYNERRRDERLQQEISQVRDLIAAGEEVRSLPRLSATDGDQEEAESEDHLDEGEPEDEATRS